MYTYELFEIGFEISDGHGFNIFKDDTLIATQRFAPGLDGYTPMSEEAADILAREMIGRLEDGAQS